MNNPTNIAALSTFCKAHARDGLEDKRFQQYTKNFSVFKLIHPESHFTNPASASMPRPSRPRIPSRESEEPLLLTDNFHDCDCFILVEYYEKRHKALQRVLIIQWIAIVVLIFGIVLVPLSRSNDGAYWIPNELYCSSFPTP